LKLKDLQKIRLEAQKEHEDFYTRTYGHSTTTMDQCFEDMAASVLHYIFSLEFQIHY